MLSIVDRLSRDLGIAVESVTATLNLLNEGATIPFIARYRKEVTLGLDDVQLRRLDTKLGQLTELETRRADILRLLQDKGIVDDVLIEAIRTADTRTRLDDLYLPFQDKRRTKGQLAIEAGIQPLADQLLSGMTISPEEAAIPFISPENNFPDSTSVLDGARAILCEFFIENADLMGRLRDMVWKNAVLRSSVIPGQEETGNKFSDYFDSIDPIRTLPSHRLLAMMRGERLGHLRLEIDPLPDATDPRAPSIYDAEIRRTYNIADQGRPTDAWLMETARWCWRTKARIHIETSVRSLLWDRAEAEAIQIFAANLKDLLMAAPAGSRTVLAMDPGLRNGVKCAILDRTGRVLAHEIVYPHTSPGGWQAGCNQLGALCRKHSVEIIAIGNGTASRETDKFAGDIIQAHPDLGMVKVIVSEAGASIYSASEVASAELPDLDVSIRGAVSIGRRLQDPLAELVKIDPKSIGVGQYQHDVSESLLSKALDAVVEDCVNAVGVDLNIASPHLLARISGIGPSMAEAIVRHRNENGPFLTRKSLLDVPRLGEKTFEQCAGFLRIMNGSEPLDRSGVHPESYPLVASILHSLGSPIESVLGDQKSISSLRPEHFVSPSYGLPTVKYVLSELAKPGRDPRPIFVTARHQDGIEKVSDLKLGMILEGTVASVAAFGAFVDIGVHENGLVHISAMSHSYVKDPRDVVRVGDIVKVKITSIDLTRNRIGLSMRLDDDFSTEQPLQGAQKPQKQKKTPSPNSAMAEAMVRAFKNGKRR